MQEQPTSKLRFLLILSLIIFIFLAIFFLFGDYGYIRLIHLRKEVKLLQKEVDILKQENQKLREQIKKMRSDLFTIEKEARNKGGLTKKGEKILKFK